MKLFHLFAMLMASTFIHAQIATVSNDRPSRGDIVEISYTPDSSSTFQLTDKVYVSYQVYGEDFSISYQTEKMKRIGESFIYSLEIGPKTSVYDIYFKNRDKEDNLELVVKPVDENENFYRNSYRNSAYSDLESYKKEMESYPDNYTLFVPRWRELFYINKDSARAIISSDLEAISSIKIENPEKTNDLKTKNESTYYALSMGNAILGDFDAAWPYFLELMENYPTSSLFDDAHGLYSYLLYSHSANDSLFKEMTYSFIKSNPSSAIAKRRIWLVDKQNDSDKESLKAIARFWMNEDPEDANMKFYYAKAQTDKREKIYYLNEAVNTLLNDDLSVKMYYTWENGISRLITRIAQEFNEAGAYAQALSLIELFEKNSNQESAWLYRLKGMTLQSLNNYEEAFELYSLAGDMGDKVAPDSAKSIFAKMDLYNVDFEEYTNEVLSKLFYAEEVSESPKFEVEDMYGKSYKSEDLVGKVIVLNFWFIGCAPCIKEMPGLNEMVEEYDGKDVVFIAFASDSKGSLEKFLKKREFKYNVIPAAYSVSQSYNVNSYPTHVIIDKKGNVRATLTGGSADRHKDIMPYIDRVLRF